MLRKTRPFRALRTSRLVLATANRVILRYGSGFQRITVHRKRIELDECLFLPNPKKVGFRILVSPQLYTSTTHKRVFPYISQRLRKRFPHEFSLFFLMQLHVNVVNRFDDDPRVPSGAVLKSSGRIVQPSERRATRMHTVYSLVCFISVHYSISENSQNKRFTVVIAQY